MTRSRLLILILGPPLLIALAYALSYPAMPHEDRAFAARLAWAEARRAEGSAESRADLESACAAAARDLGILLPGDYAVVVQAPFVLAGNVSAHDLERLHRQTVLPLTEALWRSYFDRRPDRPVTILAARDEATYRELAQRFDGYEPAAYAGYTQRSERRIVFNAGTGAGTLAHELAHALALFDFPEMPEWFDEGLASLHEDATFSTDGLTLTGAPNWRCRLLVAARRSDSLPDLETVVQTHSFRGEGEGLNYAVVRGLCLYLQDRGLLAHFYRKFRANVGGDPSGLNTLCELLDADSASRIDQQFREWIERKH